MGDGGRVHNHKQVRVGAFGVLPIGTEGPESIKPVGPGQDMPDHPLMKANLDEKFKLIKKCWRPKIIAQVNQTLVKLVKFEGEFVWHHHDTEDEMFLVLKGQMRMDLEGQEPVVMEEGNFITIPRGVKHRPVVEQGVSEVMMIEPATTVNTGDVGGERTVASDWI